MWNAISVETSEMVQRKLGIQLTWKIDFAGGEKETSKYEFISL
jgi:hypothetical protein